MSSSAALFQILYQNDVLFQLHETVHQPEVVKEKVLEPVNKSVKAEPEKVVETIPEIIPEKSAPIPEAKSSFPALNHKVLILTNDPANEILPAAEALLLDNILKAVGNSSANSDILNFSFIPGADASKVLSEKRTNYFITFGVPLIKLNLDLLLVPYAPKLVEGIWFLLADPLAVIDADKALKKKLWLALQKIFEKP